MTCCNRLFKSSLGPALKKRHENLVPIAFCPLSPLVENGYCRRRTRGKVIAVNMEILLAHTGVPSCMRRTRVIEAGYNRCDSTCFPRLRSIRFPLLFFSLVKYIRKDETHAMKNISSSSLGENFRENEIYMVGNENRTRNRLAKEK